MTCNTRHTCVYDVIQNQPETLGWRSRSAWNHQVSRQVAVSWTYCRTVTCPSRLSVSHNKQVCVSYIVSTIYSDVHQSRVATDQCRFVRRLEFLEENVVPVDVSEKWVRLKTATWSTWKISEIHGIQVRERKLNGIALWFVGRRQGPPRDVRACFSSAASSASLALRSSSMEAGSTSL